MILSFKCTGDLNQYILYKNTTIYGQIITADELVFKSQYLSSMKVETNWYWNQQPKQNVITLPTGTILQAHMC